MRILSLTFCLILVLSGCMFLPPQLASPSEPSQDSTTPIAEAAAPVPTETPDLNAALPLPDGAELAPLSWEGDVPALPDLEAWFYRATGWKDDYDVDAIWRNLYGDTPYDVSRQDALTIYKPPEELRNEPFLQVLTRAATQGWPEDGLYVNMEFPGKFPGYEPIPLSFDEAAADAKAQVDRALGTDEFTQNLSSKEKFFQNGAHDAYFHWARVIDGVPVASGGGVNVTYFYIGRGMTNIDVTLSTFEPEREKPPIEPIPFEQALHALNYYRAAAQGEVLQYLREYSNLIEVGFIYTGEFSDNGLIYSPAWAFTLEHSDGYSEMELTVDMESGEVGKYIYNWERVRSPFPNRPESPAYLKEKAEKERFDAEYAALFPLTFAQADGFTYFLRPAAENFICAEIWRRNDATGDETLLDENACSYHDYDNIKDIRSSMFAALIGDRIVFRGYDPEDHLDYKRGGQLVSIALDGSDRRLYDPKLNVFYSLCADGERLYYIGWSGNDPQTFKLNYLDPLLSKDRAHLTLDKRFIGMKNGEIYAFDADGDKLYRKNGDGWDVVQELSFAAQTSTPLLESDGWRIYGEDGEEFDFTP